MGCQTLCEESTQDQASTSSSEAQNIFLEAMLETEFWLALVYDENLKGEKYSIVYENNCG